MPLIAHALPSKKPNQEENPDQEAQLKILSNPEEAAQKAENLFGLNSTIKNKLKKKKDEMDKRAKYLETIMLQRDNATRTVVAQAAANAKKNSNSAPGAGFR